MNTTNYSTYYDNAQVYIQPNNSNLFIDLYYNGNWNITKL